MSKVHLSSKLSAIQGQSGGGQGRVVQGQTEGGVHCVGGGQKRGQHLDSGLVGENCETGNQVIAQKERKRDKGGKTWTAEPAADETELPGEEDTAVGKER